jgi:hypothetical protein
MADFCKACSTEHFGKDMKDLAGLGEKPEHGSGYMALCEGCWHTGNCLVDHEGLCLVRAAMEHAGIYQEHIMKSCPQEVIDAYLHSDVSQDPPPTDVAVPE